MTRTTALLTALLFNIGCSATRGPAASPEPRPPSTIEPAPAPPEPGTDPQPIPEPPAPTDAKRFTLGPAQAGVAPKGKVTLDLVNTTGTTHRYHHPGGSSGCSAFSWRVQLIAEDGTIYDRNPDFPGRMCTAVMVPPSDHVFEAGAVAAQITIDLGSSHYAYKPDDSVSPLTQPPPPVAVPSGSYRVVVRGAGITAEAKLTVQ
jgi:hypothetical protein